MAGWNTLFVRLLLLQAATAVALLTLLGVLFYAERNRTIGRFVAERWAPALRAAAGLPAVATELPPLQRAAQEPEAALPMQAAAPRFGALLQTLRDAGVPVQRMAWSPTAPTPTVWVAVQVPGQPLQWYGLADELVEPRLPQRVLLALVLGVAGVALTSAFVARRLARPLERLRQRMQQHTPGADVPDAATDPGAVAEVAAIDATWRDTAARLQRHEHERQLLLAGISHDLRSPLARIRMAAELLPEGAQTQARRAAIVRNVAVADRLIESFLDHVRAGALPLDENVDLLALAQEVVAALPGVALQAPPSLPQLRANRLLLLRLLQNLLDNALRHGAAPVRLLLQVQGAAVLHIAVEDGGPGLPPGREAQLLQAFARGDPARGGAGTGLGLSVVQRIVERLGGRLGFAHEQGCHRVSVELPLHAGPRGMLAP